MGWYLRKSIRIGPLRLNLSRRGLGASVGVKGLRAGVDASGRPYVAGGRGGLYFRERVPSIESPRPEADAPRGRSGGVFWALVIAIAVTVLLMLAGR
jgi:uncharacterized protein DUF4236